MEHNVFLEKREAQIQEYKKNKIRRPITKNHIIKKPAVSTENNEKKFFKPNKKYSTVKPKVDSRLMRWTIISEVCVHLESIFEINVPGKRILNFLALKFPFD